MIHTFKDEVFWDMDELATGLKMSQNSVFRMLKREVIPGCFRFNGRWLISAAAAEQFIANYDPRPGRKSYPQML